MTDVLAELESTVREAGLLAQRSRAKLQRDVKADGSIVTNGDRDVEEFLRPRLTALVGRTGIWGEEFGRDDEGESGLWVVDPIDGTSNYACGSPLWGVSVGLVRRGSIELGAVFLADLDEMALACRGGGTTLDGVSLPQIPDGDIMEADPISVGDNLIRRYPNVKWPGKIRSTGSFVIDGVFTATQRFRGLVGFRESLYDVAPCVLFCLELGAEVRYASGEPFLIDPLTRGGRIDRPWMIVPHGSGLEFSR